MAYDPERFREAYLDEALPIAVAGWTLARVTSDRVRAAIDLALTRDESRLTVFVERRVAGGRCFATTDRLALSYYAEAGVDDTSAAAVTEALAVRFRAVEARADALALDAALTVGGAPSITGRPRTLELRINRECNERCLFCNTPETSDTILPDAAAVYAAIASERAAGYRDVTFTGREPTLDPELPGYLEAARDAGYRTIRVQTNGSSFAHAPALARLVAAGMNTAEISLHTLDADTFARLIGPPRLLDKTLAGLAHLAATPAVDVHLVIVLTRLNLAHLPGVLARIAAVHPGVRQITVSPMAPVGDGAAHVTLVPRLPELAAPLTAALEVARRHRLALIVPSRCGAPLCAMPPGTERFNGELDNAPGQTLEAGKSKPAACASCRHDPVCTGLWTGYRAAFGDEDVRPVP